jgi:hypothetical protein
MLHKPVDLFLGHVHRHDGFDHAGEGVESNLPNLLIVAPVVARNIGPDALSIAMPASRVKI